MGYRVKILDQFVYSFLLLIVCVFESVFDSPEIGYIPKKHPGIYAILVYIVEIRQQYVSPVNEVIQRLRLGKESFVDLIQFEK